MIKIPVHKLQDKTDTSFQLKPFNPDDNRHKESLHLGAHRDDHYIFFIILKGCGSMIVDFEEITVSANELYYILPEQIHYRIQTTKANGWFVAIDPSLVDLECRNVFESWSGFKKPVLLSDHDISDYNNLLHIIYRKTANQHQSGVNLKVLHALLPAFLELAAGTVGVTFEVNANNSRPTEIFKQFKKLLNDNIRSYKSPSDYASLLCISEHYLNECVRKITGSSISFWIKYKTITEAKRLLYFSNLNIKQIAAELGFENQSYFSRFFIKQTGMTALIFRKQFKGSR